MIEGEWFYAVLVALVLAYYGVSIRAGDIGPLAFLFGRKALGRVASIPDALQAGADPLPKKDPDRLALEEYHPTAIIAKAPTFSGFESRIDRLFVNDEVDPVIDIGRLGDIVSTQDFRRYEVAFLILAERPVYPIEPPTRPSEIEGVPSWTPWRPILGEPQFDPPLWGGRLSFLDKYVLLAHRDEFAKVGAARLRKKSLLEKCASRNDHVAGLAANRRAKFGEARAAQGYAFQAALDAYRADARAFEEAFRSEQTRASEMREGAEAPGEKGLMFRVDLSMRATRWPKFVSAEGQSKFDVESGIVIHEHRFPDLSGVAWVKAVQLKSGLTWKPANQREKREAAARIYPALCLRLAAQIVDLDNDGLIKAVAVNGWADYTERSTGQRKRAHCATLFATREQVLGLDLDALDPVSAFSALKGICSPSLELVPVVPVIRLDTDDPRFVDAKAVLSKMEKGENLASMDWEDFEHLCRELFERAFADSGAEVKVTQASRDQGVDAVVFDPDPLRGGKIIIQAKRYTNTVDVAAVRDLYGAVINEGAVKGILVTTSHFGAESYSFAKDKPLTLLNGSELLGLLEKHGYSFRINLTEARARM